MVQNLDQLRIVDLTKPIIPGEMGGRRCELRLKYQSRTDDYYCEIDMMSHLGTHIEAPRHWNLDWKSVGDLPASHFLGRCVMLNITNIDEGARITCNHMDTTDGGRVREGDIVLVDTPHHLPPFSFPEVETRPYVNAEMAAWLVDKGVKLIGFSDSVDIETEVEHFKAFHEVAMAHDICFLEVLENFDQLKSDIFFISASF